MSLVRDGSKEKGVCSDQPMLGSGCICLPKAKFMSSGPAPVMTESGVQWTQEEELTTIFRIGYSHWEHLQDTGQKEERKVLVLIPRCSSSIAVLG